MDITILYPADYFDTKKVDEDYLPEWTEAGRFPEFHRLLYAYDSFASNGPLKVFPSSCPEGLCIYRGWMLQPSDYRRLYAGLKGLGLTLINSPEEYENCHEFPLSYEKLHGYTPKIRVYPDGTPIDWDAAKKDLGSFMMKDYVKSVKGSHFPSYFDGSWDNTQLDEAVRQFRSLRGGLFVKGIVLKQYVSLYRGASCSAETCSEAPCPANEYRAFYLDGQLLTLSPNSNQPSGYERVPVSFVNALPRLDSRFYTVDFAQLTDGGWTVIETGDGQVSGLSPNQFIFKFYDELRYLLC